MYVSVVKLCVVIYGLLGACAAVSTLGVADQRDSILHSYERAAKAA